MTEGSSYRTSTHTLCDSLTAERCAVMGLLLGLYDCFADLEMNRMLAQVQGRKEEETQARSSCIANALRPVQLTLQISQPKRLHYQGEF